MSFDGLLERSINMCVWRIPFILDFELLEMDILYIKTNVLNWYFYQIFLLKNKWFLIF